MLEALEVLFATGGESLEFFSTHPSPDNRRERVQEAIEEFR